MNYWFKRNASRHPARRYKKKRRRLMCRWLSLTVSLRLALATLCRATKCTLFTWHAVRFVLTFFLLCRGDRIYLLFVGLPKSIVWVRSTGIGLWSFGETARRLLRLKDDWPELHFRHNTFSSDFNRRTDTMSMLELPAISISIRIAFHFIVAKSIAQQIETVIRRWKSQVHINHVIDGDFRSNQYRNSDWGWSNSDWNDSPHNFNASPHCLLAGILRCHGQHMIPAY